MKKLYKSRENRVIWGICGGIGEYFDIDPVIIRLIWLVFVLGAGVGVLVYIVAALIVPNPVK